MKYTHQMKMYGWTGNRNSCNSSQVLYHWAIQSNMYGSSSKTTTSLPLHSVCLQRNTKQTPYKDSLTNKCLIKDGHGTKCTRKIWIVEINNFLHTSSRRKMCENVEIIFRKITQTLFFRLHSCIWIILKEEHVDKRYV